jgi:hypothetical protein
VSVDLQPGDIPEDLCRSRPRNTDKQRAELSKALAAIPDVFALLWMFILPGSKPADPDRRISTASPSRPPLNLEVLDLLDIREKKDAPATRDYQLDRMAGARRQGVLPTLSSWVRYVEASMLDAGEEPQPPPDEATVVGECGWLNAQLDWIVEQEWAYEFDNDIHKMLGDLRRAIGERDDATAHLMCKQCGWQVEPQDNGQWFRCTGCHHAWSWQEIHRAAERKRPKSLKDMAGVLNRSERTLRRLRAARLIKPVARDGTVELYDVEQVTAVLRTRGIDDDVYRKQDA